MCTSADYPQQMQKLGYACIFSRGVDDAAEHLATMLTARRAGYSEGPAFWSDTIRAWIDRGQSLSDLIHPGCALDETQWRAVLESVLQRLDDGSRLTVNT